MLPSAAIILPLRELRSRRPKRSAAMIHYVRIADCGSTSPVCGLSLQPEVNQAR